MKSIVMMLSTFAAVAVAYQDLANAYYKTIANDMDAFRSYMDCMVDKGPCNDFGKHAKEHIKEILKDDCAECDDVQKHFTHILITNAKAKLPELYNEFEAKYDPKRKLVDAVDEKVKTF